MKRSILARLDRLERARVPQRGPLLILSTMPLPDEHPTAETIAQWVTEGLAQPYAGSEHIFVYNGGRLPMTSEEWGRGYAPDAVS